MSDKPRDWDKELADIDRAIGRMPEPVRPPTPGSPTPAIRETPVPTPAPVVHGPAAVTTTWLRVSLVLLLAASMPLWPYGRGCGFGLFAYLAAASVVVLGGIWAAVSSWRRHRAIAHIVALLVIIWGLGLLTAEVLPRVGYAKQVIRWTCG